MFTWALRKLAQRHLQTDFSLKNVPQCMTNNLAKGTVIQNLQGIGKGCHVLR